MLFELFSISLVIHLCCSTIIFIDRMHLEYFDYYFFDMYKKNNVDFKHLFVLSLYSLYSIVKKQSILTCIISMCVFCSIYICYMYNSLKHKYEFNNNIASLLLLLFWISIFNFI